MAGTDAQACAPILELSRQRSRRARRNLTVYIPVRYYHRPNGRDDTHGYGTQSRFLTAQAEALCERIDAYNTAEPLAADHAVTAPAKVQVDLANLWR